jgi:hypothetical protein
MTHSSRFEWKGWNGFILSGWRGLTRSKVAPGGAILHRWAMMFDPGPIRRPNPLAPSAMTPAERRADLCGLLALGLVRLQMRDARQVPVEHGEFSLHNSADQRAHATPIDRRTT